MRANFPEGSRVHRNFKPRKNNRTYSCPMEYNLWGCDFAGPREKKNLSGRGIVFAYPGGRWK
jgi:hypothetical protein